MDDVYYKSKNQQRVYSQFQQDVPILRHLLHDEEEKNSETAPAAAETSEAETKENADEKKDSDNDDDDFSSVFKNRVYNNFENKEWVSDSM